MILGLTAVVLTLGYEFYVAQVPSKPQPTPNPVAPKPIPPVEEKPAPPPEPAAPAHAKPAPAVEEPAPLPAPAPPERVIAPPEPGKRAEFGARVLKKGMQGDDVRVLQERLRLAGFVRSPFRDGYFDDATEKALMAYQQGTRFLREMYYFNGVPGEPKPYADANLCRQLLDVPGRNKTLVKYTIRKGDTLFRIGTRFGVGPDALTTLNEISDPSALAPGQTIFIICNSDKAK